MAEASVAAVAEREAFMRGEASAVERVVARLSRQRLAYTPTPRAAGGDASFRFDVRAFGAVGDGVHDDGPAIRSAVSAACAKGPGAVVRFTPGTYRCGLYSGHRAHIVLEGVKGVTIEGQGARLVATPPNSFVHMEDCEDVAVRGFILDFDVPLHTQGTITAVDREGGTMDVRLHAGYPFADGFAHPSELYTYGRWGVVVDPIERHRKWGVGDHTFLEAFEPVVGEPDLYRVTPQDRYVPQLGSFEPGDRFVLNVPYRWPGEAARRGTPHNIYVHGSRDCLIEDVTMYMTQAMNTAFSHNTGPITVRGLRITYKPDTDHLVSGYRDGMHCKFNRGPLIIEHCLFEGMMDDSINISTMGEFADAVLADDTFGLPAVFREGDRVMVFDPGQGHALAVTRVAATAETETAFARECLFMHPPYRGGVGSTVLALPVAVPAGEEPGLRVGVGLDPNAGNTDGVTYRVRVDGTTLWEKHCTWSCFAAAAAEEWVDLRAYAGRTVSLEISVDVGPHGNAGFDWAFWTRLDLVAGDDVRDLLTAVEDMRAGYRLAGTFEPVWLDRGFSGTHEGTGATVARRTPVLRLHAVTLADPVAGVVPGRGGRATQFYNLSACGAGSQVRSCVFGPQRRHALLLRAPDCVFEGNIVNDVGGSGVWLGNEVGHFNEGPLPSATTIRNNVFLRTQNRSVFSRVACYGRPSDRLITPLAIVDNVFAFSRHNALEVHDAAEVSVDGNLIRMAADTAAERRAAVFGNVAGVHIRGLHVRDLRGTIDAAIGLTDATVREAVRVEDCRLDLPGGVPLIRE